MKEQQPLSALGFRSVALERWLRLDLSPSERESSWPDALLQESDVHMRVCDAR